MKTGLTFEKIIPTKAYYNADESRYVFMVQGGCSGTTMVMLFHTDNLEPALEWLSKRTDNAYIYDKKTGNTIQR